MTEKMEKVVVYTEAGATWHNPMYDFANPETLESYLREAARGGYKITERGIWATDAALLAASDALARDAAESRRADKLTFVDDTFVDDMEKNYV